LGLLWVISLLTLKILNLLFPFIVRLVPDKIKVGNRFDSDASLVRAIIKVQSNKEVHLTDIEASALKPWKLGGAVNVGDEDEQSNLDEPILSALEQMNRDRKRQADIVEADLHKSAYDPAIKHCVLGSAAEVERVWSMAGHVLTEHRSSLSPYVFELIMYLKYNSRLWGLKDVVNANVARKKATEAAQRRDVMEKDRSEEVEGGQSPT
jgi:hypothetical protein